MPRRTFLPFAPPAIDDREIDAVVETLRSGWLTTGPRVRALEAAFAAAVRAPEALAVASGTHALHLALLALGIGAGDEVIVPTITFCSTAHVVEHVGATPVIVDVDPETLCLDPAAVEAACTPRTRAVIAVHLYGHPCPMAEIDAIAAQRGLAVVEDAAHAFPAAEQGLPVGRGHHLTAFSLYATKNITSAEGGLLTGPPDLLAHARPLALHGMSRDAYRRYDADGSWRYDVHAAGLKCNMSDVHAAIGLAQLAKVETLQARRRAVARRYTEAFQSIPALECPVERPAVTSAWHIYALRLREEQLRIDRDGFIQALRARQIGSSVHFIPLHRLSYYRDRYALAPDQFPVAEREWTRLVSLPLHPTLSDADVEDVIEAVLDIVREARR